MANTHLKCRFCSMEFREPFIDLGFQPLANAYVPPARACQKEAVYPLRVFFCDKCHLVQQVDFVDAGDIFVDYSYFSSVSSTWVEHARRYVDMITDRLKLGPQSQVIEIGSNDGYLLQHFIPKEISVLGIEPSKAVAQAAVEKGIETQFRFFGVEAARDLVAMKRRADLIIGNNVLAHVPDLHDFVEGLSVALKSSGTLTIECPHLLRLLAQNQFDTIYHEHFSYFSLEVIETVFARHGLVVYDVEEIPTHGGSIRVYARAVENTGLAISERVANLRRCEEKAGLHDKDVYMELGRRAERVRESLLNFLRTAQKQGQTVVGYGAPAKGNTLLNYCGIGTDLIAYTVDLNVHKQEHLLPGSRIPIEATERIRETRPDYVLILPWNLREEIVDQLSYLREWGGQFVVPIPELLILK